MQKYAPTLFEQCGEDITECTAAQTCLPEDAGRCSVIYCNTEATEDECEDVTEYSEEPLSDVESQVSAEGDSVNIDEDSTIL
jgi:hypothetical protein